MSPGRLPPDTECVLEVFRLRCDRGRSESVMESKNLLGRRWIGGLPDGGCEVDRIPGRVREDMGWECSSR
jgi:hypothetical protein